MRGRRLEVIFRALPLALLLLLPASLAPAAAAAQEGGGGAQTTIDTPYRWIERSLRVGIAGGYVAADRGISELGPGSTPVLGARGRARISSPLSLEAGVLAGRSDRFVVDPRLPGGPAPVDTVDVTWLLAEAAVQFALTGARTWHGLQPYLLVGGGFLVGIDDPVSPRLPAPEQGEPPVRADVGVSPVVQAGAGAEWKVGERWGIAFEARDHLWRISTPDAFFQEEVLDRIEDADLPAPQDTDWTHNLGLTVTVWRYF